MVLLKASPHRILPGVRVFQIMQLTHFKKKRENSKYRLLTIKHKKYEK